MKQLPGINVRQLRTLINKTLKAIDLFSPEATNLLLRTAAQESLMGHYLKQLGEGPAQGIFQMEKATFYDHISWLEDYKPKLFNKILEVSGISTLAVDLNKIKKRRDIPEDVKRMFPNKLSGVLYPEMMQYNIKLAICMARIHYFRRDPNPIPKEFDDCWLVYKQFWNTKYGAATYEEFKENSRLFGL